VVCWYGSAFRELPGGYLETIFELAHTVTPAYAGVQNSYTNLDSGFRRNDVQRPLCHFEIVS
jgi:hypothetical protein